VGLSQESVQLDIREASQDFFHAFFLLLLNHTSRVDELRRILPLSQSIGKNEVGKDLREMADICYEVIT
jgi:hypothetical protein